MIDILLDALHDTWAMIPLLYIAYLIIETFERKADQDDSLFWNLQKWGPAFGALLGLLPQCGFAVLAAMLFLQNNITLGTMVAVFIATSDEAIPVLISDPQMIPSLGLLLVFKFILATAIGYFCDAVLFPRQKIISFADMPEEEEVEEYQEDEQEMENAQASRCSCCYPQYPMWISAALRTLKIYLFIFLVTLAFNALIYWIGTDQLSALLMEGTWWQTMAAALFGFIPNCAATVVLCELFANGALSFGSLFAGLVCNAGLGLLVLFKYSEHRRWIVYTMLILFLSGTVGGYLLNLFL